MYRFVKPLPETKAYLASHVKLRKYKKEIAMDMMVGKCVEAAEDLVMDQFDIVDSFAAENAWFSTEFTDSLKEQYLDRGSLSPKQIDAVSRIISKLRMKDRV